MLWLRRGVQTREIVQPLSVYELVKFSLEGRLRHLGANLQLALKSDKKDSDQVI